MINCICNVLVLYFIVTCLQETAASSLTSANWKFNSCLSSTKAEISLPSNETWWYDSQGVFVPVLRQPVAVAYASTTDQVVELVRCAVKFQTKIAPRSGGHSYEAFSSADRQLVIDVSRINSVEVDPSRQSAVVGAGIRLGKLYYNLSAYKLTYSAGDYLSVGLGGQVASGGYGYLLRKYGLAADNVLEIEVVDWLGNVLIANETLNSDLFWALRGGGGGSYGIMTKMKLKVYPFPKNAVAFNLSWKEEVKASELCKLWLKWKPWHNVPDEMTFTLVLAKKSRISGIYIGDDGQNGVKEIFKSSGLFDVGGTSAEFKYYSSGNFLDVHAWFFNGHKHHGDKRDYEQFNTAPFILNSFDLPPFPELVYETLVPIQSDKRVNATPTESMWTTGPIPGLRPAKINHAFEKHTSQVFTKEFDNADAFDALDHFTEIGGATGWRANGGFMYKTAVDYNAFPHRHVLFDVQHHVRRFIRGKPGPLTIAEQNTVYQNLVSALEPYTNHRSYQGYADLYWSSDPHKYMPRYYGNHVKRLIEVKRKYDPHDFFRNEQSTPLHL